MQEFTRNNDQEIQIGDNITVKICRVGTNKVLIGIKAPEGFDIIRSELPKQFAIASDFADHDGLSDDPDDHYANHPGPYNPDYSVPQSNLT